MHRLGGEQVQPVGVERQYLKICGGVRMVGVVTVIADVTVRRLTQLGARADGPTSMF